MLKKTILEISFWTGVFILLVLSYKHSNTLNLTICGHKEKQACPNITLFGQAEMNTGLTVQLPQVHIHPNIDLSQQC